MALSGSKTVAVTKYDDLKLSWSASQNISGNYSTVRWTLTLSSTANGRISSTASKDWAVTIAGERFSGTNTVGISASSAKTLASGSVRVDHDSDGTKSFNYAFSQEFDITFSGSHIGTIVGSGSATLDTIPRASSLSVPTINLGSSGTLTINRASNRFTHTVTAKFGSYTQTIASKTSSTSLTFSPPLSWADAIPNATRGTCTYTIHTYNGSTKIGTKTTTGTLKIALSGSDPVINSVTVSDAVTETANKIGAFVQTKSKLKLSINASGKNGATISKCEVVFENVTYSGTTVTTDYIQGYGNITYTVRVTDSRGVSISQTNTISVLAYSPPTISTFSAFRCVSGGVAQDDGTRLNVSRNWQITPLNNKNTNVWELEYRRSDAETWTNVANGNGYSVTTSYITSAVFDPDYAYELRVTLTDHWGTSSKIVEIPTAFTLVDYNGSGRSISFGGVSTRGADETAMDIKMDAYDQFGARINNGLAMYTGGASNAIDPNTTIEELILTDINTPISGFMFITTVFYGDKTATANRAQTAIPYSNVSEGIYFRNYYNGAWGEWKSTGGDTGWITPTLTSNFTNNSTQPIQYRKIGKMVEISGTCSPSKTLTSSTSYIAMFTLPEGFRPSKRVVVNCKGSSVASWMALIDTDGTVNFSRYISGADYTNPATGISLLLNANYFID